MKLNTKLILALGIALCYFILPSSKTFAQGADLGVYPPIIQIDAKPPASINNPISIENFSSDTLNLNISYKIFKPKENGDIEFVQGPLPKIFQNMQIYEGDHVITQVVLAPKQKKTLIFHVGIQPDEKPQDYYFSILFISNQSQIVGSSQSMASAGVASNVILSIGPNGGTMGRISKFSSPFFVEKGPVPFTVMAENTSSHYITTNGIITIKNIFGQTVGKIDLLSVNVLSNSERIIPSAKEEDVSNPKAIWNEKFLLGPYTAKLTLGLSEQGPIYTKTITFFAFPLQLLAGLIVSICVVVLIVKRIREKQKLAS